jgi:hypothetical protein
MALVGGIESLNIAGSGACITLGNRNDYCYICAREIKGKDERDYQKQFNELKGKYDGKPVLKISGSGIDICICPEHIKKFAKDFDKMALPNE